MGCGLGGPARDLADRFGCRVIGGSDLTPELVDIGNLISARTGLSDRADILGVGDLTSSSCPTSRSITAGPSTWPCNIRYR